MKYGEATPWVYWRWELAERFGWTLDYVDSLTLGDLNEFWQIQDGKAKARR